MERALRARGIAPGGLFSHQTEAIDALLQRRHVAVCTSTASGKSLCYNVPILQVRPRLRAGDALQCTQLQVLSCLRACDLHSSPGLPTSRCRCCRDRGSAVVVACRPTQVTYWTKRVHPGARQLRGLLTGLDRHSILQAVAEDTRACALFMFPTKALAQDQRSALATLAAAAFLPGAPPPPVEVYDGDTPQGEREGIRQRAQLLITNPDMLHVSVLPFHGQFRRCAALCLL